MWQIASLAFLTAACEYTVMRMDCGRQRRRAPGFTFHYNPARPLGLPAGAAMASIRLSAIAGAFLVFLVASATAQTQPIFRVGGLTCDTGPRVGLVLGSRQDMRCVFVANATGEQYTYRGTIRRVGVDIGVTRGGRLFWRFLRETARSAEARLEEAT